MKIIVITLVLLLTPLISLAATQQQQDEVSRFLQSRVQRGTGKPLADVKEIKHLGKTAFHLLAGYLPREDLGYAASQVMIELDPNAAAILLFQAVPQSSSNANRNILRFYVTHVVRGNSFAHKEFMYQAALRYLKYDNKSTTAELAVLAIGLTGSKRDFPLLIQCYRNKTSVDRERYIIHDAAEASLARLGSKKHLDSIAQQLNAPIPAKPTFDWAYKLSTSMHKAAFSNQPRFVPLLRRHLNAPTPKSTSDAMPHSPAHEAASALKQLTTGESFNWHL